MTYSTFYCNSGEHWVYGMYKGTVRTYIHTYVRTHLNICVCENVCMSSIINHLRPRARCLPCKCNALYFQY